MPQKFHGFFKFLKDTLFKKGNGLVGAVEGGATTEGVAQVVQVREESDEKLERHSGDTGALSWVWGIVQR